MYDECLRRRVRVCANTSVNTFMSYEQRFTVKIPHIKKKVGEIPAKEKNTQGKR